MNIAVLLISEALATHYNVAEKIVNNAIALSDIFHVAEILETEGQSGLRKLVLKPLNPVKPALAGIAPGRQEYTISVMD